MKWSDLSRVETLLTQRKDILNDKARVEMGMFDLNINARQMKDFLEPAELEALRDVFTTMLDRRTTEVDAKLLDLGVTIDPDVPVAPDPVAP